MVHVQSAVLPINSTTQTLPLVILVTRSVLSAPRPPMEIVKLVSVEPLSQEEYVPAILGSSGTIPYAKVRSSDSL